MGLLKRNKNKKIKSGITQDIPQYQTIVVSPIPQDPLDIAVAQVISSLATYGLHYEVDRARQLLKGRFAHANPTRAVVLALALRDAEDLIVVEPSSSFLLGAENLRGTTCYLDALLFSMFSRSFPIFDALLYHARPDARANKLVVNLRVFVNLLRCGYLVTHDLVDMLRNSIASCGWQDASRNSQQDTSECFGFIAEILQMPTLTFKVHIAHSGKADAHADNKIVKERFLALPIPKPSGQYSELQPIELVDLIDAYFHTKLEVRRPIARSRSTMSSMYPTTGRASNGNSDRASILPVARSSEKKRGSDGQVAMEAWQLFELVPYYSAQDSSEQEKDFARQPPVVAINLKRYFFDTYGTAQINKTPVIIPEYIDFTPFTDSDNTMKRAGDRIRLRLDSAVCHRGQHVGSGHYVSISRGDGPGQWLLFDDLSAQRVTQSSFGHLFSVEVPYLLFYQLETIHPRRSHQRLPSFPSFNQQPGHDHVRPPYPVGSDDGYVQQPYPSDLQDRYFTNPGIPPPIPENSRPNRH
ncbi:Ubiquitin C-terminal hydrolase family protein [Taphrina deformans PYCC 5710]|uniref:ubiquitinyl hydrolase 1 n=1 Tax=Taphrina deformans (strain PYCC 5710 / ATCC 11124 / CBS 356.35 / IMI 108563 / JCM 9778 / NBRC 8474) TaxID=1097556 RepID=R4XEM6_TAPDE|nr:Ubiquitin C-terminal hydrolase family protein [Taphrina deformans PYCC 5710]|eukprot:CCG82926.1 Ubiquitin C-terminal hydrolase family protein [Taphrina deformans PYCC 5710]